MGGLTPRRQPASNQRGATARCSHLSRPILTRSADYENALAEKSRAFRGVLAKIGRLGGLFRVDVMMMDSEPRLSEVAVPFRLS